jgi:hypothetical protein
MEPMLSAAHAAKAACCAYKAIISKCKSGGCRLPLPKLTKGTLVQGLNPDIADGRVDLGGSRADAHQGSAASAAVCIPVGMCRPTLSLLD